MEPFIIYFGKSCCGKSTRLKSRNCLELDRVVWDYVRNPNKEVWATVIKKAIMEKDRYTYDLMIRIIGSHIDWDRMFNSGHTEFDIPVIGIYWSFLPEWVKCWAHLVKITTSDENRQEFAKKRGKDDNFLSCVDFFYKDPPHWDAEWFIERQEGEV